MPKKAKEDPKPEIYEEKRYGVKIILASECDHALRRARIGAGYLVCPNCNQEIPN